MQVSAILPHCYGGNKGAKRPHVNCQRPQRGDIWLGEWLAFIATYQCRYLRYLHTCHHFHNLQGKKVNKLPLKMHPGPPGKSQLKWHMVSYFTEKIWNTQQGHVLYYLIQLWRCTVSSLSRKILSSSFWVKTTICEHFRISIEMKIWKYISGIASGSNFPTPVPLKCQLVKKQMNLYKWGET